MPLPTRSRKRLLVTGMSGVVGQSLLEAFPRGRLVGLVHTTEPSGPAELVRGDVTIPRLGLSQRDYSELLDGMSGVIHTAAITSFVRPRDAITVTNVQGTRVVTRMAEEAQVPLHYVSTIYVRENGGAGNARANAYQQSKRAAEEVVGEAAVPTTILRPSVIIGDSATGAINRFQGIYAAMKELVIGNAHVVPVAPGSAVDFLPRDYVAGCIRAIVEADVYGDYWITAGTRALRIEDLIDACMVFAARLGREPVRPKAMAPDVVERLVLPAFGNAMGAELRTRLELFSSILGPMSMHEPLPDSCAGLRNRLPLPDFPDLFLCLDRALSHWSEKVRLGAPVPVPAAAARDSQ